MTHIQHPQFEIISLSIQLDPGQKNIIVDESGGNRVITMPKLSDVRQTDVFHIQRLITTANTVDITGDGSETINGVSSIDLDNEYQMVRLQSNGTEWRTIGEFGEFDVKGLNQDFIAPNSSRMHYPYEGDFRIPSNIIYVRQYLPKDVQVDAFDTWINDGGSAGESLRFGIYDQSVPLDRFGNPNNRVAQTNSVTLDAGDDQTFVQENLISPFVVPTTGYYWFAMIVSGTSTKVAVSEQYLSLFIARREETGTGSILPASTTVTANPEAPIPYFSGFRQ